MWLLLLACRPPESDAEDTEPLVGTDSDSVVESPADSPVDSDSEDLSIRLVSRLSYRLGWAGYEVALFEVPALPDLQGLPGRFHVVWPEEGPSGPVTVLLDLHGGSIDDDSTDPVGSLERCGQEVVRPAVEQMLLRGAMPQLAAEAGWVLVAPENPWCDGWFGLGEEDPVDTRHQGFVLAATALDYLAGELEVERTVVMGQSLGSLGALWFAGRREVEALAVDSGPPDALSWYTDPEYSPEQANLVQGALLHTLGDPEQLPGRYRAASLLQVQPAPVFHLWNAQDPLSLAVQHAPVADLLAGSGLRWGDYDVNHPLPRHPQTTSMGALYGALAAQRFLDGQQVRVVEGEALAEQSQAEDGCSGGAVGLGAMEQALDLRGEVTATFFLEGDGRIQLGDQIREVSGASVRGTVYSELREDLTELTLVATDPTLLRVEGELDVVVLSWAP